MNVTVFGLTRVGCVTAACLARGGHIVCGVDVDGANVGLLNAGQSPFVEPGLGELIASARAAGRLRATTNAAEGLRGAHVALICVGTQILPNGQPDVDAIDRVAREIGKSVGPREDQLAVVLRSTVLPGATERVLRPGLLAGMTGSDAPGIRVAVNPEFMREGSSLVDFDRPPMILVGTDDPAAAAVVRSLYLGVRAPFVHTSIRTAELAKCVASAYWGVRVTGARDIADIAAALGADVSDVMEIFALRSRRTRAARTSDAAA